MRYKDTGNLHLDFHIHLYNTMKYIKGKYGDEFLKEVFRRTAQRVYKDIYENLKNGNYNPLVEYWDYYLNREEGKYRIKEEEGKVILTVDECPAVRHLKKSGLSPDKYFCFQDIYLNEAWSEKTPFNITVEIIDIGKCIQMIERIK